MKTDVGLQEKLVDYMNFFEFIASLWAIRELKMRFRISLYRSSSKNFSNKDSSHSQ